jgi:hypothetical protein
MKVKTPRKTKPPIKILNDANSEKIEKLLKKLEDKKK